MHEAPSRSQPRNRASRRHTHAGRLVPFAAAAGLAVTAAVARAGDTHWIGAAGAEAPFWDVSSNWSAGLPGSFETRALLGASDSILRAGTFKASQVIGSGRLQLAGGALELRGPGSSLGHLDLTGGRLGGGAEVSVGTFTWTGGAIGSASGDWEGKHTLFVRGAATLSGSLSLRDGTAIWFNGPTHWNDGVASIGAGYASLNVDSRGLLRDDTVSGDHTLGATFGVPGELRIKGRYLKTGAGSTTVSLSNVNVDPGGALDIRGGQFLLKTEFGGLDNQGDLILANARLSLAGYQTGFRNSGRVRVLRGGIIDLDPTDGGVDSVGTWIVEQGGRVVASDAGQHGGPPIPVFASVFAGGAIHNEGIFTFRGGAFGASTPSGYFVLRKEVAISGRGTYEALDGVDLTIERDLDVGGLRIGQPHPYSPDAPSGEHHFSRVAIKGSVRVDRLDWEDGYFDPSGPVTVAGLARLSNDWSTWGGQPPRFQGKEINTAFNLLRHTIWDGDGSLVGTGEIRVAEGGRFEDHNARGTLEHEGGWRPGTTRVAVSLFANGGRYEKYGAGTTVIQSRFYNAGSVVNTGAGPLVFAGPLDNSGTLEAVRSRLSVWGPLQQLQDKTLTGGRYVARDGVLVFNLPVGQDPMVPPSIEANAATLVLDGPHARMVTPWLGTDADALGRLYKNTGRIEVLNGADLKTEVIFHNHGELWVAGGGMVHTSEYFSQSQEQNQPVPSTWLDGSIEAPWIGFAAGSLGPGTQGGTGTASLAGSLSFGAASQLLLDVQDAQDFDRVSVSGKALLAGTLNVDFLGDAPVTGRLRVLSAARGIEGRFEALTSSLDPALFRLSATYAPNHVDLTVSAVPEPGSWALALAGWAVLCVRRGSRATDSRH